MMRMSLLQVAGLWGAAAADEDPAGVPGLPGVWIPAVQVQGHEVPCRENDEGGMWVASVSG